jgi:hypothetical protein
MSVISENAAGQVQTERNPPAPLGIDSYGVGLALRTRWLTATDSSAKIRAAAGSPRLSFDPSRESSFVFGGVILSLRPPLPVALAIALPKSISMVYGECGRYQQ